MGVLWASWVKLTRCGDFGLWIAQKCVWRPGSTWTHWGSYSDSHSHCKERWGEGRKGEEGWEGGWRVSEREHKGQRGYGKGSGLNLDICSGAPPPEFLVTPLAKLQISVTWLWFVHPACTDKQLLTRYTISSASRAKMSDIITNTSSTKWFWITKRSPTEISEPSQQHEHESWKQIITKMLEMSTSPENLTTKSQCTVNATSKSSKIQQHTPTISYANCNQCKITQVHSSSKTQQQINRQW